MSDSEEISGVCDEQFSGVKDLLAGSIAAGTDLGASVAISVNGEMVVDIWGGWADPEKTRPWERDTITNVWSTTKTMTALCALILADAGELDVYAPVSRYWPEFAAGGKGDKVLVSHLMSHTAGLPGWTEPMTLADLYDWDKATSLLAAQEPWWEPGTEEGYHAVTQGYLVGEVVRRITGQSLGTFFREKVAGPLGADFHIGLDPSEFSRISNVVPPPPLDPETTPVTEFAMRTLANPPLQAEASWTDAWRKAEIPAANGHGNARSVATIQSVLVNGGEVQGVRLLSEKGCERALEEQHYSTDLVFGIPMRYGLGYGLPSPEMPVASEDHGCFWGGWGGSAVVNDFDAHMTVAYMMNKMGEGLVGDDRGIGIVLTALEAAGRS